MGNKKINMQPCKEEDNYVFGKLVIPDDEVWKPISSYGIDIFDTNRHEYNYPYFITNYGRVYSMINQRFLGEHIKNGHTFVIIPKGEENKDVYIHRLVAYFFCPHNRLDREIVHHIDNNPLNNHAENLLWVTQQEHIELHNLMKSDTSEYKRRVAEILEENKG